MSETKERIILGVNGSPRAGGNTEVLMDAAREGVLERGGRFELVRLRDASPIECDGCHVCWKKDRCAKTDTMNDIYPRIARADGVIFGTPVYWYGPTGLMKTFLDRFVYFNCDRHRGKISGTPAATLIPFEETDPDTAAPVAEFFRRSLAYLAMPLLEQLQVPGVTKRGEVKQNEDALEKARTIGRKLAGYPEES